MDGCKQENKMTTGYEKEDVMKREGKRITAWIMAFIMVWSLVMVPGGTGTGGGDDKATYLYSRKCYRNR